MGHGFSTMGMIRQGGNPLMGFMPPERAMRAGLPVVGPAFPGHSIDVGFPFPLS
jgi:hypothetical protein